MVRLGDLPHFTIEGATLDGDDLIVHGIFDRAAHVRESGWLYLSDSDYLWGQLSDLERASGSATFRVPGGASTHKTLKGMRLPWIDAYWDPRLVVAVIDLRHEWKKIEFQAQDALEYRRGDSIVQQPASQPLPTYAVDAHVVPGGWEHEHCEVCTERIGVGGHDIGFVDSGNLWLCEECHDQYGEPHDLSFMGGG